MTIVGTLRVYKGAKVVEIWPVKDGINTIGRGETNDIPLNFQGVSRAHAEIEVEADSTTLTDLGSTFKTRLADDQQVTGKVLSAHEAVVVQDGNWFNFGGETKVCYTVEVLTDSDYSNLHEDDSYSEDDEDDEEQLKSQQEEQLLKLQEQKNKREELKNQREEQERIEEEQHQEELKIRKEQRLSARLKLEEEQLEAEEKSKNLRAFARRSTRSTFDSDFSLESLNESNEDPKADLKEEKEVIATPVDEEFEESSNEEELSEDDSSEDILPKDQVAGVLLVYDNKKDFVKKIYLKEGIDTIGRTSDSGITLDYLCLSRTHAEIEIVKGETTKLTDLKSTNKTRWIENLSDNRLGIMLTPNKEYDLPDGQWIMFGGELRCQFILGNELYDVEQVEEDNTPKVKGKLTRSLTQEKLYKRNSGGLPDEDASKLLLEEELRKEEEEKKMKAEEAKTLELAREIEKARILQLQQEEEAAKLKKEQEEQERKRKDIEEKREKEKRDQIEIENQKIVEDNTEIQNKKEEIESINIPNMAVARWKMVMDDQNSPQSFLKVIAEVDEKLASEGPVLDISFIEGGEKAIRWDFDPSASLGQWKKTAIIVKLEPKPFSEGSIRFAHKLTELNEVVPKEYVAKISKTEDSRGSYFDDVKMQVVCKNWAEKYNQTLPPKEVEFLPAHAIELIDRPQPNTFAVEPYISGDFVKHNNNSGGISSSRNTPQAFSHFTYEASNHELVIIDVQGVNDQYTDPQIHCITEGTRFGLGNLGQKGIDKFIQSHRCNAICAYLGLPKIGIDKEVNLEGTVPKPNLGIKDENVSWKIGTGINNYGAPKNENDLANNGNSSNGSFNNNFQNGSNNGAAQNSSHKNFALYKNINIDSFKVLNTFKGEREFKCVVSTDKTLFGACADKTIYSWDLDQIKEAKNENITVNPSFIRGHHRSVEALCKTDQYLFSGGQDFEIKVWSLRSQKLIHTMKEHDESVWVLRSNKDNIYSGSADKTIKIWDASSFSEKHCLTGHKRSIKALCVNDNILFSGSNDKTIKVWDIEALKCTYTLKGHDEWLTSVATAGPYLFSSSNDKSIKIWDLKSLECTATLRGHEDWVNNLVVTEKCIISASEDQTIKIWDLATLKCLNTLENHTGGVSSLYLSDSQDINHLYSGSMDNTVKAWSFDIN